MTNNNSNNNLDENVSLETVIHYLRQHPKVFLEQPDLLTDIAIPHQTGAATSLVERQVSVLREQLRQSKNQLKELIEIARENTALTDRVHQMALDLVQLNDLPQTIKTIRTALLSDFKADKVALRLFTEKPDTLADETLPAFVGSGWSEAALFSDLLTSNTPLCGRLKTDQQQALFADELPEYCSAVLLPLKGNNWQGVLAIGSQSPERFQKDMGTDILTQFADLVTLSFNAYL